MRSQCSGSKGHYVRSLIVALQFLLLLTATSAYKPLSDHFLRVIPSGGDDFDIHNGALLAPILVPRVPGTPGQLKVQEHFVNFFKKELPKWTIEWQNSSSKTPVTGDANVPFANLIFKRVPPWTRPGQASLLTLVAHYDSKYSPDGFIGATDSAVPCAVLMHVARSINTYMTQRHERIISQGGAHDRVLEEDIGVQIILLDGEEAFLQWTATDSLYGSRSLAETWESTPNPALSNFRNPLSQISLFVLFDLLGSAGARIPSYFQTTHWAYKKMATIEERLRNLGLLESHSARIFADAEKSAADFRRGFVEDDHVPFMARGVPILHIIPTPFPAVWHTLNDDGEHLDMATVRDWAKIATAFALEWLNLMDVEPTPQ
ncbi:hypothetical protein VTK73DRAFT_6655 [Phialemonium thermophilum]|uniref:Peptide hydrolase n=1 Tax=Phialemonium thermophilum TaxID=223376 RepID=A0ABR3WIH3_9PEZI